MSRTTGCMVILSVVSCVAILAAALTMGQESKPGPSELPPPERAVRPPFDRRPLQRPRPIEGGSYYYDLAEVHKMYGVYDKAIEMLQQAIEKETVPAKKTRYYESLSEVYRMKGEPQKAAEQINKALADAKTIEEKCRYYNVLGRIHEETGDIEGAKKAYEFVVANVTGEPEKRSAQLSLFRLYQKSGEIDNVVANLEKKLEDNPSDEEALNTLAQILNSVVRQPAKALNVYERLSKLKPKDMTVLNRLVYLYQGNKEYEKAAEAYKRIMESSPSPNKSYYYQQISRMYMMAGKKKEAAEWAEKSLSEGGARPYTYVSVAQIYLQNDLAEKAFELYDKALEACARPIEKHQVALRFADMFALHNREDKAEEIYKYVLKEATVASFKSRAKSKLISLYRKQGKTSEIEALGGEEEIEPAPDK